MSMTSSNEVIEKTKNMLSVGEVPDLIFTGGYGKDSVYQFMEEKNKAVDLMPYLEKDPDFAECVAPEIISYWQKDGKLYTVSDVLLLGGGYWYNAICCKSRDPEDTKDMGGISGSLRKDTGMDTGRRKTGDSGTDYKRKQCASGRCTAFGYLTGCEECG